MHTIFVAATFLQFWAFVLDPATRHMKVVEWINENSWGRCLGVLEAMWATVIGLSPFWIPAAILLATD